jgi:hypothetical protein
MKKRTIRLILVLCASALLLLCCMCCSMNKLHGYAFREHTASALLAYPPPPEIFADNWADVDFSNPVTTIIGIGTGIAKEVQIDKTRAKMDSAMQMVDIPEIVRVETLDRGANYLHYRSTEDIEDSDYLFDIEIEHYGIDAKSWTASVHFKLDAKITLFDNRMTKAVWRSCFKEEIPVSGEIFGLPGSAGNIITAVSLSRLKADQIALALENLAVQTADRIIHKLQEDFSKKNR